MRMARSAFIQRALPAQEEASVIEMVGHEQRTTARRVHRSIGATASGMRGLPLWDSRRGL